MKTDSKNCHILAAMIWMLTAGVSLAPGCWGCPVLWSLWMSPWQRAVMLINGVWWMWDSLDQRRGEQTLDTLYSHSQTSITLEHHVSELAGSSPAERSRVFLLSMIIGRCSKIQSQWDPSYPALVNFASYQNKSEEMMGKIYRLSQAELLSISTSFFIKSFASHKSFVVEYELRSQWVWEVRNPRINESNVHILRSATKHHSSSKQGNTPDYDVILQSFLWPRHESSASIWVSDNWLLTAAVTSFLSNNWHFLFVTWESVKLCGVNILMLMIW